MKSRIGKAASTAHGGYEVVIGLEVHVELLTQSKIFCGCPTAFGAPPNTQCCPVCMGLPGALPVLNEAVLRSAVRAGLALHCAIAPTLVLARKNYFYPDLPKAYQISQGDQPIASRGYLDISTSEGDKRIGITRLHIEEDAGKLVHTETGTLADFNRCGVPLIEIVSEPDFRSAAEVRAYLELLRATVMALEITSGRMNEGAFRCDVNLSVRPMGSHGLGTRTEMKNLNSFAAIEKAIAYEAERQIQSLKEEIPIVQETRRWDADSGKTTSMRVKEDSHDYRYFPDPDLPPIAVDAQWVEGLRASLPELPDAMKARFEVQYGLTADVAERLITQGTLAQYVETVASTWSEGAFESQAKRREAYVLLGNLAVTELIRYPEMALDPVACAHVVTLVLDGTLSLASAKKLIAQYRKRFPYGRDETADDGFKAADRINDLVQTLELTQVTDREVLTAHAQAALGARPQILSDYRAGKHKAMGAFMGEMMKRTGGRAHPEICEDIFIEIVRKAK